ncbi:hypothetical protein MUK72_09870 [Halococcus dombrowskii]|nr:hypothetical protein [Halococcus dombrowskii]UOO94276.1 hypothetical protein MUK72_09870 [Halococcus dombrowskii]
MKAVDREILNESDVVTGIEDVSARIVKERVTLIGTKEGSGKPEAKYTRQERKCTVEDSSGEVYEITEDRFTRRSRLPVWLGLLERADGALPLVDHPDLIPVEVATMGKPEICGYLFVVHQIDLRDLSGMFDVNYTTVRQYMSDIASGRRKKLGQ